MAPGFDQLVVGDTPFFYIFIISMSTWEYPIRSYMLESRCGRYGRRCRRGDRNLGIVFCGRFRIQEAVKVVMALWFFGPRHQSIVIKLQRLTRRLFQELLHGFSGANTLWQSGLGESHELAETNDVP